MCRRRAKEKRGQKFEVWYPWGLETNRAEQEKNNRSQTTEPTGDGTPEDTASSSDRGILSFFRNVTRRVESNQNASGSKIRKTPVPASWSPGTVVCGHKGLMGGTESPGLSSANGQPDKVQDKVEHHDCSGPPEDISEISS